MVARGPDPRSGPAARPSSVDAGTPFTAPLVLFDHENSPSAPWSGIKPLPFDACQTSVPRSWSVVSESRRTLARTAWDAGSLKEKRMEGIIYLVGLVVVVMFVLSFLGLR